MTQIDGPNFDRGFDSEITLSWPCESVWSPVASRSSIAWVQSTRISVPIIEAINPLVEDPF